MSAAKGAKLRGTIVKVPDASPGLLVLNGQQMPFTLQGVWLSPVAPAANMTVDVELDSAGAIAAITVVDAKEVAAQKLSELTGMLEVQGNRLWKGLVPGLRSLSDRMGTVSLGAAVLVWISWFFFRAASVNIGGGRISFTFWNLLGIDFASPEALMYGGRHGLFSLLGIVAITVPFVAPFLRTAWSNYLNGVPLAYFVVAFIAIFVNEHRAFSELATIGGANPFSWSVMIVFLAGSTIVLARGALKKAAIN
jgi:hypothetical protein